MPDRFIEFLCNILKGEPENWPTDWVEKEQQQLVQLATSHGVLALLNKFTDRSANRNWPSEFHKAIAIALTTNSIISKKRTKVISEIFQRFAQASLEAVIFKGAANAYLLYEQPEFRQHADIDMLVSAPKVNSIRQVLNDMGFKFDNTTLLKFGPYQSTAILRLPNTLNINIDLHWKINNRLLLADLMTFDEVWRDAIPIKQYGNNAYGFSYQNALLVSCIHEAGCLPVERNKLIGLYDAYLLMNRLGSDNIKQVLNKAVTKKIAAISIDYLTKSISSFGNNSDKEKLNSIVSSIPEISQEPSARFLNLERSWYQEKKLDWIAVTGIFNKTEYLLSKLSRKLFLS